MAEWQREDHPTGVVFYRLHMEQISPRLAREGVRHVAELYANGMVVRSAARRDAQEGIYWIGFNTREAGAAFEGFLRRVSSSREEAGESGLRVGRAFALPTEPTNPELPPVLERFSAEPRADEPPTVELQPSAAADGQEVRTGGAGRLSAAARDRAARARQGLEGLKKRLPRRRGGGSS